MRVTATESVHSRLPHELASALAESNLPSIDGIRALAVVIMVFYHLGLAINGGLGVTMFFTLSGFLITWLLLKELAKWKDVSLRLFYIRRSFRIFPAFYAFWFLVVVVLGVAMNKPVDWGHAISAFFYVGNYYQALTNTWTTPLFHTWSLAIEEQFYLIWPAVFIAYKGNIRRLLLIAIPCFWLLRLTLVAFGTPEGYIYAALETRADHLLIGCALAALLFEGAAPALFASLLSWPGGVVITLALLAASSGATVAWGVAYRNTIGFIVDPLLVAVLIVQGLALRPAWLNWHPIRYLGRISYSVYLYHMIAIAAAMKVLSGFPWILQIVGALAAALFAAMFSFHVIERPFLRWKDRFGQRKGAVPDRISTHGAERSSAAS